MKYNDFFYLFFFFFGNSPTFQTRRRIFPLDGSNDADSLKGVPFGGFIDISPHFGVKSHKTPGVFTARCYAYAVLAMALCLSVRLSARPSQVGVLLKRLNV